MEKKYLLQIKNYINICLREIKTSQFQKLLKMIFIYKLRSSKGINVPHVKLGNSTSLEIHLIK